MKQFGFIVWLTVCLLGVSALTFGCDGDDSSQGKETSKAEVPAANDPEVKVVASTDALEIRLTEFKGRGVFAKRNFAVGDIIEICPVIIIPESEWKPIESMHIISNYPYEWGADAALALGYGGLYNHSYTPNAKHIRNTDDQTISFFAIKPIEASTEITFNYNGKPDNNAAIVFEGPTWYRPE